MSIEIFLSGLIPGLAVGFFLGWRICQKNEREKMNADLPVRPGGSAGGNPK